MEENVRSGGFGERFLDILEDKGYAKSIKFIHVAIPDVYVEHGNVEILKKETGIDKESVLEKIREALK
jgi:1-deoxy-D-xylulose-5-phosphate synthase